MAARWIIPTGDGECDEADDFGRVSGPCCQGHLPPRKDDTMHIERSITAGIEHRRLRNALLVGAGLVKPRRRSLPAWLPRGRGPRVNASRSWTTRPRRPSRAPRSAPSPPDRSPTAGCHQDRQPPDAPSLQGFDHPGRQEHASQRQQGSRLRADPELFGRLHDHRGYGPYSGISGSGTGHRRHLRASDSGGSCASSQLAGQSTVAAAGPVSLK